MSDDETTEKPEVFLAKPPKKVGEMTEDKDMTTPFDDQPIELSKEDLLSIRKESEAGQTPEWIEKYGDESWKAALAVLGFPPDTTDPDSSLTRRRTQVSDEVAELNAGKITVQDETTEKPEVFLAKPPKKVGEMTEEEKFAWVQPLAERLKPTAGRKTQVSKRLKPTARRRTQVSDDVAELNAGKITVQELGERWAARTWIPSGPPPTRDVLEIAAREASDYMGPDGSWYEVEIQLAKGTLSRDNYRTINRIMEQKFFEAKAKGGRRDEKGEWASLFFALDRVLGQMDANEFLIIFPADDSSYYVQVVSEGPEGMRAEAVSKKHSMADEEFDDAARAHLEQLGWKVSTDKNFYQDWKGRFRLDDVSSVLVRTLHDVFRVESPGSLSYRCSNKVGSLSDFDALGIGRGEPVEAGGQPGQLNP
jgi:hypothetical protein